MVVFVVSLLALGGSFASAQNPLTPQYLKGTAGQTETCDQVCSAAGLVCDSDGYYHVQTEAQVETAFSVTCNSWDTRGACTCNAGTDLPLTFNTGTSECLGRETEWKGCENSCSVQPPAGTVALCACYSSCAAVTCPAGWDRIPNALKEPSTFGREECCVRSQFVPTAADGVTWTLGAFGASCDQTCAKTGSNCDLISLTSIQDKVHYAVALNQANPNADMDSLCRCEAFTGSPSITGTAAPHACTWGSPDKYSCSEASMNKQMLCACKEATCDSFDCAAEKLTKKPNAESIKGSTAAVCCEQPTCASYDCTAHGLVQKPGSQNTPGSTVGECCAKVVIGGGGTGSMPDVDLNILT